MLGLQKRTRIGVIPGGLCPVNYPGFSYIVREDKSLQAIKDKVERGPSFRSNLSTARSNPFQISPLRGPMPASARSSSVARGLTEGPMTVTHPIDTVTERAGHARSRHATAGSRERGKVPLAGPKLA
jgi:hypothetical protein